MFVSFGRVHRRLSGITAITLLSLSACGSASPLDREPRPVPRASSPSTSSEPSAQTPAVSWNEKILREDSEETPHAMGSDRDGNLFVAGSTMNNLGGASAGRRDAFVEKFSPHGERAWAFQWGTADDDQATSIAIRDDGHILVAVAKTRGMYDLGTAVFGLDAGGKVHLEPKLPESLYAHVVAFGSGGEIFVAGDATESILGALHHGSHDAAVVCLRADGSVRWARLLGSSASELALSLVAAPDGGVFVGGSGFMARLDASGGTKWLAHLGPSEEMPVLNALALTPNGGVVAAGELQFLGTNSSKPSIVMRFSPEGQIEWQTKIAHPWEHGILRGVVLQGDEVVAAGVARRGIGFNESNILTARLELDGKLLSAARDETNDQNEAFGLALAKNGPVLVARSGRSLLLRRVP